MADFDVIYLGRTRFHRHHDATTMYFRVLQNGRYVGAYAGAVAGPDMAAIGPRPTKAFWAALAHATTRAIGVRLMGSIRTEATLHAAETIWLKVTDLRPHLGEALPLPAEDEVFTKFAFSDDPFADDEDHSHHVIAGASSRVGLRAAAGPVFDD